MDIEYGIDLEIAGVDVDCLLWDLDDVEIAVRTLSLYHQFSERFSDAFHCIDNAMSYWLEDGCYADCAESTTTKMFYLRSVIEQHVCFSEATSLPRAIRGVLGISHTFIFVLDWRVLVLNGLKPDRVESIRCIGLHLLKALSIVSDAVDKAGSATRWD